MSLLLSLSLYYEVIMSLLGVYVLKVLKDNIATKWD